MSKYSKIYGVDISKDVFDIVSQEVLVTCNTFIGFKEFIKQTEASALMVVITYYHHYSARYLYENGKHVSTSYPLSDLSKCVYPRLRPPRAIPKP